MDASEKSKTSAQIISFPKKDEGNHLSSGGIIKSLLEQSQEALGKSLSKLFDQADDTLFDLAGPSTSGSIAFFDGFRELRLRRRVIELAFKDQLLLSFKSWESLSVSQDVAKDVSSSSETGVLGELSLIDDDEFEEDLAINAMITHANALVINERSLLERRLAIMRGASSEESVGNPISPEAVAKSFKVAMKKAEGVSLSVRIIVYKLFDRLVMAALRDLYIKVNKELGSAGLFPEVRKDDVIVKENKPSLPLSEVSLFSGGEGFGNSGSFGFETGLQGLYGQESVAAPLGRNVSQEFSDRGNSVGLEVFELFKGLLSSIPRQGISHGMPSSGAIPQRNRVYTADEMLLAISSLRGVGNVIPNTANIGSALSKIHHEQKEGLDGPVVSSDHEVAIEMISMLFDLISEDHSLSADMRAGLARLQLPYLKAAIRDPQWFADESHPAKFLLAQLAEAGKGCAEHEQSPITELIEKTINNVHNTEIDNDAFQHQVEVFSQEISKIRQKSERVADRTRVALNNKEKREIARKEIAHILVNTLKNATRLPAPLYEVLIRAWAHNMVMLRLRFDTDSVEYLRSLRLVEFLSQICDVEPLNSLDCQVFEDQRSEIMQIWTEGLIYAGLHESDVNSLSIRLATLCDDMLDPLAIAAERRAKLQPVIKPEVSADDPSIVLSRIPHESILDSINTVDENIVVSAEESPEYEVGLQPTSTKFSGFIAPQLPPRSPMEIARGLEKDQWVEVMRGGVTQRLRVCWVSSITGRLLFVNSVGQNSWDTTREEVANYISTGDMVLVENGEVVERAMTTIRDRLRKRLYNVLSSKEGDKDEG